LSLLSLSPDPLAFRPIHYLGSKLRLIRPIRDAIDAVAPSGILCDLFAGSGTVSRAFAVFRPTISVDVQEYSRVLCAAMLTPAPEGDQSRASLVSSARGSDVMDRLTRAVEPLLEHEARCISEAEVGHPEGLWNLVEYGSLARFATCSIVPDPLRAILADVVLRLKRHNLWSTPGSLVTRHFGGPFFSFQQAVALDALLDMIHGRSGKERDTALAPLLSTASTIVNSIGKQFAQPLKPRDRGGSSKAHLLAKALKDRTIPVWATYRDWAMRFAALTATAGGNEVIRSDYHDFLRQRVSPIDVFYADPPYTRDHYSRYYHVLETMCLRDEPALSTTKIKTGGAARPSRGLYRVDRHQSPFSIRSQAPRAFDRLFAGVRRFNVPLVLSYSPSDEAGGGLPRVVSVHDIVALAQRHFRNVDVRAAEGLAHSKLNRRQLSTARISGAEVLITCKP
jgi:adenine-specific DNA methylase